MSKRRKKLRLKRQAKIFLVVLVVLIIAIIVGINKYKEYLYHQTYEYKLLENNYNMDEVNLILSKLDDDYINELINSTYNSNIIDFLKEKYFIKNNLDRYLAYLKKNKNTSKSDIISLVNVNRDREYYDNVIETDLSKDILILVNKYYQLPKDYIPENIIKVSSSYAYAGNSAREDVLNAFIEMAHAAKDEDITLIINSSYRSYNDQDEIWNYRKTTQGTAKADAYAARAGHSEHQSGLALDIAQFNSSESDFENTPAFTWLSNHAHEYGFILRFPKDKENITGYSYESWHYRYVGKEVATKIKQENITFDEYYAYYIEKGEQ